MKNLKHKIILPVNYLTNKINSIICFFMSDITQQQFDGIDFYPVVWPWSISVFTFYTLYTCIIIPLVIWRSDFHPLKSRSKGYLFVMIFTQYLMVTILSLRLIIGRQIFPCALYYVFAFFGVPSLF
jgi:hypothetical protein